MLSIKLMADYGCYPLWRNDGNEVGNIDPNSLPISSRLKADLGKWAAEYDAILNQENPIESSFSSKEDEVNFVATGYELAVTLSSELSHVTVAYYDMIRQLERSI